MEGCGYCDLDYRLRGFEWLLGKRFKELSPPPGGDHRLKEASVDAAASDHVAAIAEGNVPIGMGGIELPTEDDRFQLFESEIDPRGGDPNPQVDEECRRRLEALGRPSKNSKAWRATTGDLEGRRGGIRPDVVSVLVELEIDQGVAIDAEPFPEVVASLVTQPVARHAR